MDDAQNPAGALSASPSLHGISELQTLLTGSPSEIASEFGRQLATWLDAAAAGALDLAAIHFYVDFYGPLGERWRELEPERAAEFAKRLTHFLQHAVGLFPFSPGAYQEFPDGWVQRVAGRMLTGRVRRVIRPGLQDRDGQLRTPALVELE